MDEQERAELEKELEQYRAEKEKVRQVLGRIGGEGARGREKLVTTAFVAALLLLFGMDVARHMFKIDVPMPAMFSLEVGVLLVSLKIIWMIHNQVKVGHFQFWILSAIEFRVNQIANRLGELEKRIEPSRTQDDRVE